MEQKPVRQGYVTFVGDEKGYPRRTETEIPFQQLMVTLDDGSKIEMKNAGDALEIRCTDGCLNIQADTSNRFFVAVVALGIGPAGLRTSDIRKLITPDQTEPEDDLVTEYIDPLYPKGKAEAGQ